MTADCQSGTPEYHVANRRMRKCPDGRVFGVGVTRWIFPVSRTLSGYQEVNGSQVGLRNSWEVRQIARDDQGVVCDDAKE
ncbi:hypothetical protein N7495_003671 [Penicillium taxi]|uniref:uncharacterized protein n=1 Tax=Penicillium taxi TaxID=168475 RepID=UPI002545B249|nr:uncharacterized protein N7495_003671 [Penicillium taxi]KAJ5898927.1 hypothetical protein N7495_003671 [Penicillium taxi]